MGTGFADVNPNVPLPKAGETALFRWVDPSEVVKPRRDKARRYVDRAAADLGLGHVGIRWFRHVGTFPAPPERIGMLTFGEEQAFSLTMAEAVIGRVFYVQAETDDEIIAANAPHPESGGWQPVIGLNRAIRGELLKSACRHEVRHLAQRRMGLRADELEADAYRYAGRAAA